ncbi:hypothetical protein AAVH_22086 [Aphelenchoides avenae]|nr:hypothetical protein AAVH_22086 [Aphelenchus avenae]
MGPHCAKESDFPVEQLSTKKIIQNIQVTMKEIATCVPNFLIRYNNYDEAVYKTFVKDISTLVYHELTMVSFYLGIDAENAAKRKRYRSSLPERVRGIMKQLLDARAVLIEEPPKDLADAVKSVVRAALREEKSDIGSLAWKERPPHYEKAIQAVVTNLKVDKSTRFIGNSSLEGVMYLPYAEGDRGMHCAHSTDDISFNGTVERMANYFVKYMWNPTGFQSLKQKWEKILGDKNSVLDSVFSEKDGNVCDRVLSALSKRSQRKRRDATSDTLERTGFSAFVAVRCSYDFVWYELGWRYYTAARTTSQYVLEKNGGTFSADCGQLIFLP